MVRLLVENSHIAESSLRQMNRTAETEYTCSDNNNRRVLLRQSIASHGCSLSCFRSAEFYNDVNRDRYPRGLYIFISYHPANIRSK